MTLLDVINKIESAAKAQRAVHTIVGGDILRLNTIPDAQYGAFAWVQRQHSEDRDAGLRTYAFSLFYVDRLTHDRRNELEIQAVGIRTLENVLARLEDDGIPSGAHSFDTFNIRFTDECAGVWTDVSFTVAASPCAPEFTATIDRAFSGAPSTLRDVVRAMEAAASYLPQVSGCVPNDIYRLNALPDARYGVFGWTQGQHYREEDSDVVQYRFNLFYVDRLTHDRGNEAAVQSVGVDTLAAVLAALDDIGLYSQQVTFDAFTERFTDECAGMMASVTIYAPVALLCAEGSGDFNADFSDDFYIY